MPNPPRVPMHGVAGPLVVRLAACSGVRPMAVRPNRPSMARHDNMCSTTPVPVRASKWSLPQRPRGSRYWRESSHDSSTRLSVAQYHRRVPSDACHAPASGSVAAGDQVAEDDVQVRRAALRRLISSA